MAYKDRRHPKKPSRSSRSSSSGISDTITATTGQTQTKSEISRPQRDMGPTDPFFSFFRLLVHSSSCLPYLLVTSLPSQSSATP